MKYLRPARLAVVVLAGTLGFGAQASWSGAEEPVVGVYGMAEAIDPIVGIDWAPPIEDPEVAAAAADGATVTEELCTFGDRPGVLDPQIFRRPIRTTGHLVITPSGNVSLHCHAAADRRSFQSPLPTAALVVDPVPCFLPDRRRTNDARLVVTPSLQVHLTCHLQPAA
jgi:hypothetical protein